LNNLASGFSYIYHNFENSFSELGSTNKTECLKVPKLIYPKKTGYNALRLRRGVKNRRKVTRDKGHIFVIKDLIVCSE
jgi:hypothetical protein